MKVLPHFLLPVWHFILTQQVFVSSSVHLSPALSCTYEFQIAAVVGPGEVSILVASFNVLSLDRTSLYQVSGLHPHLSLRVYRSSPVAVSNVVCLSIPHYLNRVIRIYW